MQEVAFGRFELEASSLQASEDLSQTMKVILDGLTEDYNIIDVHKTGFPV